MTLRGPVGGGVEKGRWVASWGRKEGKNRFVCRKVCRTPRVYPKKVEHARQEGRRTLNTAASTTKKKKRGGGGRKNRSFPARGDEERGEDEENFG